MSLLKDFAKNASIFTIAVWLIAIRFFYIPTFKSVLPDIIRIKFNTPLFLICSCVFPMNPGTSLNFLPGLIFIIPGRKKISCSYINILLIVRSSGWWIFKNLWTQ